MDITQLAQSLLEKHALRNKHLGGLIGATAKSHYKAGVTDLLRGIQEAAVASEIQALSAPVAVQPSHSALDGVSTT